MARYVQQEFIAESSTSSSKTSNSDASSDRSTPGGDPDVEHRLYVISRSGSGEAMYLVLDDDRKDFISYKVKVEHWDHIKDLADFGVAVIRNCVYIIGGYIKNSAKHTTMVHRYDVSELQWSGCSALHGARSKFGVAVVGDYIYISGGEKNGGRITGSCEMYDCIADTWTKIGMLISPRVHHATMVYENDVYCAGGFYGNHNHNNLWVYEHYKWSQLDDDYPHILPVTLDRFTTVTVQNTFYFIGGVLSKVSSTSGKTSFYTHGDVFSYCATISLDEDITEASDMLSPWNFRLPSLKQPRHSCGSAVIGDKIYVIGGCNLETGQQVRMVEYFDLKRRKWEEDFRFRKGDVSNVVCVILKVSRSPVSQQKLSYKLKWVLW